MALGQQLDTQIHIVKEQLEGEVISYLHQLASAESLLGEGENSTLLGVKYKPIQRHLWFSPRKNGKQYCYFDSLQMSYLNGNSNICQENSKETKAKNFSMVCLLSSIVINTLLVCTCDCWCIGQRTTFFLLTSVKSFQSNSIDNGKQSKCFVRQRFYQIILSLEEGDEKIRSNFKLIIWKRGSKTRSNF